MDTEIDIFEQFPDKETFDKEIRENLSQLRSIIKESGQKEKLLSTWETEG